MITKFDRFVLEKFVYLGNVPALVREVLSIQLRLEGSLVVSVLLPFLCFYNHVNLR